MSERPSFAGGAGFDDLEAHIDAIPVEVHRERFEELGSLFRRGHFDRPNEDESVTRVVSYERLIDPLASGDIALVSEFRLRAAAAGVREAFSPLVLPTAATIDPHHTEARVDPEKPHRPLTLVQFGYEHRVRPPGGDAGADRPPLPRGRVSP